MTNYQKRVRAVLQRRFLKLYGFVLVIDLTGQGGYSGSLLFVLPLFLITLLRSWILLIQWDPAFIEAIGFCSGGVGPWSSPPGPF